MISLSVMDVVLQEWTAAKATITSPPSSEYGVRSSGMAAIDSVFMFDGVCMCVDVYI